jgi:aminoglycoside 3-N-acetyltransferase I
VNADVVVLQPGDIARLRAMNVLFGREFEDPATWGDAPPGDAWLAELLASPTFIAVAALRGNEVVGALAAYVLPKMERERSEIYLYDLAVDARCRRQGIATAMIRELQRIAPEKGAWVIFVQADPIDPPAVALYTKLGAREDVLHFDLPVGDVGAG